MQGTDSDSGLCSLDWTKDRAELGLDGPLSTVDKERDERERTYHE
jgi:hypothetical protein